MFGPGPTRKAEWIAAVTTIPANAQWTFSASAATAEPARHICNTVSRPHRVSAECPQNGFATIRAAAQHAITTPMRAASSPWYRSRYSARNGKNAAIASPMHRNRPWIWAASETRGLCIRPR